MRQIKTNIHFLTLLSFLFLISCKQPTTTSEKKDNDTTQVASTTDATPMPAYDPAMEPLTVGAQFSKLLHDTLGIKMYYFTQLRRKWN